MTIKQEVSARNLKYKTWDCDEFWNVISEQDLYDALDNFLDEIYPDGENLIRVNDLFRFEGDYVLNILGADLTGTIWDDSEEEEDEELEKAMEKCRDYNF